LLGIGVDWPSVVGADRLGEERQDGYLLERWRLRVESVADDVPALLTRPLGQAARRCPAVLYCHAHGNRYAIGKSELIEGRPSLPSPYAVDLARLGIAALCIDLPCFGERLEPAEGALSKALLWRGETLFGRMLAELGSALTWLAGRDDVDGTRIGALGLSMGATLSWWLAALDPRVTCVAELCCLADLGTLVATGAHDLHGHYMTVPGLLTSFSTGEIAGLIAPRAHLACVGLDDPLTPPVAVAIVDTALRRRYATLGRPDAWRLLAVPGSGHVETASMRAAVLEFLALHLDGRQPAG